MNRRIQVIDKLRTDRRLGLDYANYGVRLASILDNYLDQSAIWLRVKAGAFDQRGCCRAELIERRFTAREVLAHLTAARTTLVRRKPLRGIREEKLVRRFDRIAVRIESGAHFVRDTHIAP